jgi:hypothetical protein
MLIDTMSGAEGALDEYLCSRSLFLNPLNHLIYEIVERKESIENARGILR